MLIKEKLQEIKIWSQLALRYYAWKSDIHGNCFLAEARAQIKPLHCLLERSVPAALSLGYQELMNRPYAYAGPKDEGSPAKAAF